MLYGQTLVREDLIRTVDLGPFKHKIDDGLELRKAAFECMDMVLDQCRGCLDLNVFLEHLQSGVSDHYDVKMPSHAMLAKLAVISPHIVLMSLEYLVEPLEKTLTVSLQDYPGGPDAATAALVTSIRAAIGFSLCCGVLAARFAASSF